MVRSGLASKTFCLLLGRCNWARHPRLFALIDQQAVAKVLNLPETMATYCLIPVGYPLGNFGPVTRKPLSEIMRYDQWSD